MKSLTNEEFVNRLNHLTFGEYTPLTLYKGSSIKVKFVHNRCGKTFYQTPNKMYRGAKCPNKLLDKILIKCKYNNWELITNDTLFYNKDAMFKCLKHNTVFKTKPINITSRNRCYFCPQCLKEAQSNHQLITNEEAQHKLYMRGFDYILLDNYKGVHYKNKFRCPQCNSIFIAEYNSVIQGRWGCTNPDCARSKLSLGEYFIYLYLKEKHISYETQKKFSDLVDIRQLSYDFYLPKYKILIEYQGEQHYRSIRWGSTYTNINKQQYHDKLKYDYASSHGYNLICIPYTIKDKKSIYKFLDKNLP